ncbi:MAG: hypothetical protein ACRDJP_07580 [Actinomycetota bacterium]
MLDETDPTADLTAHCHTFHSPDYPTADGHIASLRVAGLTIQVAGDGTRHLTEFLDTARRLVEEAHRQWLIQQEAGQ